MEVVAPTAAVRRAKIQPSCHHQQTNIQLFYRPDALPVAQPTVTKYWREISRLWGQRWKYHCVAYPGRLQLPTTHWLAQNYNITWCGKHMGFNKLPTKVFTHLCHHWWQHYNHDRRTENFGLGSGQFPDIWQTCTEHSQETAISTYVHSVTFGRR